MIVPERKKLDETDMAVEQRGLSSPPKVLLWGVIALFALMVIGSLGGVLVFRNGLRPGQQQRIIGLLPFMEVFLPLRPDPNSKLPTPVQSQNSSISIEDLLASPLTLPTDEAVGTINTFSINVTATPVPTSTPTLRPTTEAPLTATPVVVPSVTAPASSTLPPAARLYGFRHVQQTWNNCGPASITIALSYFGWEEDQEFAASFLKPDPEDKNVSPREMVRFVNEQTGIRAVTRMGGSTQLLKAFVSQGFPVIISTGYMPEGYDWLGHYLPVVGYDDARQVFYVYDSYMGSGENGEGIAVPFTNLDRDWQHFNRNFIVLYESPKENAVREILGDLADPRLAADNALEVARSEARTNPQNGFAWFNAGTALTALERYEEAAAAYDQARRVGLPWRMLWYQFGPYEAYFSVGRYDDVQALVESNLNNGGKYVEETFYWQGRVFEVLGRNEDAGRAFRQAVVFNPLFGAANDALANLNR